MVDGQMDTQIPTFGNITTVFPTTSLGTSFTCINRWPGFGARLRMEIRPPPNLQMSTGLLFKEVCTPGGCHGKAGAAGIFDHGGGGSDFGRVHTPGAKAGGPEDGQGTIAWVGRRRDPGEGRGGRLWAGTPWHWAPPQGC